MKIAFLSTFFPFRGGIAQFSGATLKALQENHQVQAFNFKRQYPTFLFPGQTQFVVGEDATNELESQRVLDSINPISYIKTANLINAFQPDLFLSSYWMTFFGPSMGYVAKKLSPKIKRIAIVHNVKPHEKRFFDGPANRFFLSNHDGFIVLSDVVEKDLLEILPDAKVLKLQHPNYNHFGLRIEQTKARDVLGLDQNKKTILFFGIIRDYKGLDILLEAFEHLSDDFQLVIAGECYGTFEKYQNQIDSSENKSRIHLFLKYIEDQDVTNYFSSADVCILPYKSATQSGITAIAQHFCLPIISTDVGGLKETIKNNENGLIVDAANAEGIRNTVEKYFKEQLKERFEENLSKANEEKSWSNFSNKIIKFASEIVVNTSNNKKH